MAFLGSNFASKFSNTSAATAFEPIPAGEYIVKCTAAEQRQTKSGDGTYIKAEFTVIAPSHQNRKIYVNYNINNPSEKAEAIGLQQLKSFAEAGGLRDPLNDDQQLVGLEVTAVVTIRPGNGQYADSNEIKRYKPAQVQTVDVSNGAFPFGNNVKTTYTAPQGATNFSAAFGNQQQGSPAFKNW